MTETYAKEVSSRAFSFEICVAAYVRGFSTPDLRVPAARIMGIECDHRTLVRVLAADVAAQDGGPIEKLTSAQGVAENFDPSRRRMVLLTVQPLVCLSSCRALIRKPWRT